MVWNLRARVVVVDIVKKIIWEFLLILSEIECRLSDPGGMVVLRKLFLRHSRVSYGQYIWVGRSFRLVSKGKLRLGNRCAIGAYSRIENGGPIEIGDDFLGASGLTLVSGAHDNSSLQPASGRITIGDRVWCGVNVTILTNVTIGDDVIVGAGSVVTKDIPSNSIAAGVPAKVIKRLSRNPGDHFWSVFDNIA